MSRTIDIDKINQRHKSMLVYQEIIKPFTPTIRDLQELWKLNTTSAVKLTIDHFVGNGLVVTKNRGNRKQYFAIERKQK